MTLIIQSRDTTETISLDFGDGLIVAPGVVVDHLTNAAIRAEGDNFIWIGAEALVRADTQFQPAIVLLGDSLLINRGSIVGLSGVIVPDSDDSVLLNFGSVSGFIPMGGDAVSGVSAVVNFGVMQGDVVLGDYASIYVGFGAVDGQIHGDTGADILVGGVFQDTLFGDEGVDFLRGNGGSDNLNGGAGFDIVAGEGGQDVFSFDVGSDNDFIQNFQNNVDTIELEFDLVRSGLDISVRSNNLVLSFGTGDKLVIDDTTSFVSILNDVVLV